MLEELRGITADLKNKTKEYNDSLVKLEVIAAEAVLILNKVSSMEGGFELIEKASKAVEEDRNKHLQEQQERYAKLNSMAKELIENGIEIKDGTSEEDVIKLYQEMKSAKKDSADDLVKPSTAKGTSRKKRTKKLDGGGK
jgi:hypothetical protein